MTVDVSADGHDEFFQIAEDAAPKPILSEVAKETFHHVQPGRAGGSEVQMKARMPRQPALHFGMFVGGIVVADQSAVAGPAGMVWSIRRRNLSHS